MWKMEYQTGRKNNLPPFLHEYFTASPSLMWQEGLGLVSIIRFN